VMVFEQSKLFSIAMMASGAARTFGSEFAIRTVKVCCGEVWQVHARVFREFATHQILLDGEVTVRPAVCADAAPARATTVAARVNLMFVSGGGDETAEEKGD